MIKWRYWFLVSHLTQWPVSLETLAVKAYMPGYEYNGDHNHSCHNSSRQNTFNGRKATCHDEGLLWIEDLRHTVHHAMFTRLGLEKYFKYESSIGRKSLFQGWGLETLFEFTQVFCVFRLFLYVTQSSTTQSVKNSSKARGTKKMSGLQSFQGNKSAITTEYSNMCWTCGAQVNKRKESSSLSQRERKIWLTFKLCTAFFSPTRFIYHFDCLYWGYHWEQYHIVYDMCCI